MGFSQGLSGLNATQRNLTTIGNNIANSQTVGYKGGRTEFADMFAGSIGLGTKVSEVSRDYSGGSITTTGRDMDLAINGGGFFRLSQQDQIVYSRNGQFHRTKEGYIANAQGALLTGYNVSNFNGSAGSPTINTSGAPETIHLPTTSLQAKSTTDASLVADLDSRDDVPSVGSFDPENPKSFNWSTPYTVYDSLGNAHSVNLYFAKDGSSSNTWNVYGRMPLGSNSLWPGEAGTGDAPNGLDAEISSNGDGDYLFTNNGNDYIAHVAGTSGGTGGKISYTQLLQPSTGTPVTTPTKTPGATGQPITLKFTESGTLDQIDSNPASPVSLTLGAQNGSSAISFDLDFNGTTQTAQKFGANSIVQNGHAPGKLVDISVEDSGMVRGSYSNGETVNLAQLAMARFQSDHGLEPAGDNAYRETSESGQAILGLAGEGQFGALRGGALEESNVDLSEELVHMIVAQRTYQANAQTIQTQSQVLQTAVNLAR